MGKGRGSLHSQVYEWDFAKDGGAVGQIALRPRPGDAMQEGLIVKEIRIVEKTSVTSGGTPTITFGPSVDADGYLADVFALLGSAPTVVRSGEVAGALLWDDTNDHEINYRIGSAANTQDLVMDVGTAALTAGAIELHVESYMPIEE